jgi:hypothetical protein
MSAGDPGFSAGPASRGPIVGFFFFFFRCRTGFSMAAVSLCARFFGAAGFSWRLSGCTGAVDGAFRRAFFSIAAVGLLGRAAGAAALDFTVLSPKLSLGGAAVDVRFFLADLGLRAGISTASNGLLCRFAATGGVSLVASSSSCGRMGPVGLPLRSDFRFDFSMAAVARFGLPAASAA